MVYTGVNIIRIDSNIIRAYQVNDVARLLLKETASVFRVRCQFRGYNCSQIMVTWPIIENDPEVSLSCFSDILHFCCYNNMYYTMLLFFTNTRVQSRLKKY